MSKKTTEERRAAAGIEYRLFRARRRSVSIEIREGEVIVKAPAAAPLAGIEVFIQKKKDWIIQKIDAFYNKYRRFSDVFEYRSFLSEGIFYPAVYTDKLKRIKFSDGQFWVPDAFSGESEKLCILIRNFYKRHASVVLSEKLNRACENFGLPYNGFRLTDAKGKWGSCDAKNNIRLNWRLVLLSPFLCEYVILHELCHTQYHNHSKNYWEYLGRIFPGYKNARNELKNCSLLIGLYRKEKS